MIKQAIDENREVLPDAEKKVLLATATLLENIVTLTEGLSGDSTRAMIRMAATSIRAGCR